MPAESTWNMKHRIEPLDWLRGLLAVSIMSYHLLSWETGVRDASTTLGRLGIYGVSMFFILSGLSIALVYHRFIQERRGWSRFWIRRVFRIWPLLWIAVLAVTAIGFLGGEPPSLAKVVLNLTTLFGFVRPLAYINTGAWSIGNEMVYYALSPLLLMAYARGKSWGNAVTAMALAVGLYFSSVLLNADVSLADQWAVYIHPLNNLCLYCCGVALYYNTAPAHARTAGAAAMIVSVATFVLYPVQGDQIAIVTGLNRIVFGTASVLCVYGSYKIGLEPARWLSGPLMQLGLMTYGVYLLHPVVWLVISTAQRRADAVSAPLVTVASTMVITLIAAWLIYHYYELPFIRLGKRLTAGTSTR